MCIRDSSGTVGLTYRLAARGTAGLMALYTGARQDVDYRTFQRVTLPAYARVDVALAYDLVGPEGGRSGIGASVRIENLFDRVYEEIKNFPARRRTIFVGARLGFGY